MTNRIMVYKGTGNIGDNIQSVSLSRLLKQSRGFYRDQSKVNDNQDGLGIASGFLLGPQGYDPAGTFFCGVWYPAYHSGYAEWLRRTQYPVGARDPESYKWMRHANIPSEFVGCVTLTLPRYKGARRGIVNVDYPSDAGTNCSHKIPKEWDLNKEWSEALRLLDIYRKAEIIYTTRIHAALPAIAMGTPVVYTGPDDPRTSIIKSIGIVRGKSSLPDTSVFKKRFIDFLSFQTGYTIEEHDPLIPLMGGEA